MAYSQKEIDKIFIEICNKIVDGQSVKSILREKGMPSTQTFWKWLNESEEKSNQYARACELRAESIFEDVILISDGTDEDILTDEYGNEQINHNVIARDRLRVDARKWALGKMNPKKYGDKQQIDHTTKDDKISEVTFKVIK